jgi:REP element-mobilizing transposase RayT
MARQARQLSNTGVYHVMFWGNERKNVFQDDEYKQRFSALN